ncbi:hypothetical protein ACWCPQ_28465 [Nocardia sp. NPDC001965]
MGDSIVEKDRAIPSPVDDPSQYSYGAGMTPRSVGLIDRDYTGAEFRSLFFVEAQMFDITVADIDFIGLHRPPEGALRQALDRLGVEWRVLTNRAIAAEGSDSERAAAITRTSQDLACLRAAKQRHSWLADEPTEAELSADLRVLREAVERSGADPGTAAAQ